MANQRRFISRLVAYSGNTFDRVIPVISWGWNWTENASPAFTFTVLTKGPTWTDYIKPFLNTINMFDVALEFDFDGTGWVEPPNNARFIILDDSYDPTSTESTMTFTCTGVDFDFANQYNPVSAPFNAYNYGRQFASKNAGQIITTVFNDIRAHSTNNCPHIALGFSTTLDSSGQAWNATVNKLDWPSDSSVLDLIQGLVDRRVVDYRMDQNVLRLYNVGRGNVVRDGTSSPEVSLLMGRDLIDAPQTRSRRISGITALVVGENGRKFEIGIGGVIPTRGARVLCIQGAGVKNTTQAGEIANPILHASEKGYFSQLTRTLKFSDDMPNIPLRDYKVGDSVVAPGADGALALMVIRSLTMQMDQSGAYTGSLVFEDMFSPDPTRSRVNSLQGGGQLPTINGVAAPGIEVSSAYIETVVARTVTNDALGIDAGMQLDLIGFNNAGASGMLSVGADATGRVFSMTTYNRTYSNSPNMFITPQGTFGRSTSASKYKINISDTDYGSAVLDLPVKSWYDKTACDAWADRLALFDGDKSMAAGDPGADLAPLVRHGGLLAEDVETAGLGDFVSYGAEGEIEGLQYERLLTTLIPIVRAQRDAIADLEQRLAAIEGTP